MCGIYGFAGTPQNPLTLMRALLIHNIPRGYDSAGIAVVDAERESRIVKRVGDPTLLLMLPEFRDYIANPKAHVVMGHNRWATHGRVTKRNAHPFRIGNVTGTHNGVVSNVEECRRFVGRKYQVDSQYLLHMMDQVGHLGPAQGSLNLAYHNRLESSHLRLVRCGKSLHIAIIGDRAVVYSSEHQHLQNSLDIAGIHYAEVQEVPNYTHVSVTLDAFGRLADINFDDLPLPEVTTSHWQDDEYLLEDGYFSDEDYEFRQIVKGL